MEGQSPILIAYDGSDNARHALAQTGEFYRGGRPTIVLHVWEPDELVAARHGAIGRDARSTDETRPATADETAAGVAAAGTQLVRAARRAAKARASRAGLSPTWETIVDAADAVGAALIVLDSRGLAEVRRKVALERGSAEATSQGEMRLVRYVEQLVNINGTDR